MKKKKKRITFEIPGVMGKQRARTLKSGRSYTPKKTVEYEKAVREAYTEAGGTPIEGPVKLDIEAVFRIPESLPKKKKEELKGSEPLKRPDVDNIAKIIMDGLQKNKNDPEKYAFNEDSQVVKLEVEKRYVNEGEVEKVRVGVEPYAKRRTK